MGCDSARVEKSSALWCNDLTVSDMCKTVFIRPFPSYCQSRLSGDLDGQSFIFKPPTDPYDRSMILRDLPVEWHALRIIGTAFKTEDSNLSIRRVAVDTGFPE